MISIQADVRFPRVATTQAFPVLVYGAGTTGIATKCAPLNEFFAGREWGDYRSHMTSYAAQGYIAVLANWRSPAFADWGRVVGVLVLALAAGSGVYFSRRMRKLFHLDQIVARLPFASHLQRIDRAAFAFRGHSRCILACLAISVVLQLICIFSLFLAGWALDFLGESPLASLGI